MKTLAVVMFVAMILCFASHAFGGQAVSQPRFEEHLNGSSQVSDPRTWDVYRMGLIQVVDGFAIFSDELGGFKTMVGVQMTSLGQAHRDLLLSQLGQFSAGGVHCLRFLSETQASDRDGFPVKLVLYTAVSCKEAK